jgi:hypothetical protein
MGRTEVTWYHGTVWDKRLYVAIFPLCDLLLAGYLVHPGRGGNTLRVITALLMAAALFLAFRGRRLGRIAADAQGVTAYGALRRWRWSWHEIDHFTIERRRTLVAMAVHPSLTVHLRGGRKAFTSVNSKPAAKDQTWLDLAAAALNDGMASRLTAPPTGPVASSPGDRTG